MSCRYRAVLFDMDGTLLDSYEAIGEAARITIQRYGLTLPEGIPLSWFIGPPPEQTFGRWFRWEDEARLKEVIAFYRALYEERMFMGRVYPGIFPLLEALRGAGVRTSLATMKRQPGALELARRLLPLRQAGIPVLVIPGNHDIGNAFAAGYNRGKTYSVRTVGAEEFAEIYREFGYGQAISRDNASLSYVCPLSEDLWAVMLDTNKYDRAGGLSIPDNSGALSSQTLAWLEDQLEEARRQGKEVISATHHNLLDQSPRLSTGYTLDNAGEVLELYGRYGVRVNFSGHVHIQNIREAQLGGKSFYDIATSSYAVYTNQYGVVDYRPGESLSYHTQEVDMEGWAAATGSQDPQLLGFEDYSYQFFYDLSYDRSYASLYMAQLNKDADLELMAQTMAILNPAYFSGYAAQLREEVKASDHYAMWRKHSGFAPIGYINSMLEEQDQDPRQVVVELN